MVVPGAGMMAGMTGPDGDDVYTHGHHEAVLRSHRWRTADNSAAYLLPQLEPTDFRVRLTLKALYSTYLDLEELGLGEEARLLLREHGRAPLAGRSLSSEPKQSPESGFKIDP